jgi:hypothetical protein
MAALSRKYLFIFVCLYFARRSEVGFLARRAASVSTLGRSSVGAGRAAAAAERASGPAMVSDAQLVIIRHGKTEFNKLGLFTGWDDAPLAPEGRAEAVAAGQLLKAHGLTFDVVRAATGQPSFRGKRSGFTGGRARTP